MTCVSTAAVAQAVAGAFAVLDQCLADGFCLCCLKELLSCANKVCGQLCRLPVCCWLRSFSPAFAYVQEVLVNFLVDFNIQYKKAHMRAWVVF